MSGISKIHVTVFCRYTFLKAKPFDSQLNLRICVDLKIITLSRDKTKPTMWQVRQAKIQIRLEIRPFWPRGYKIVFMLNSAEHEIRNAHTYKKYQEIQVFRLR